MHPVVRRWFGVLQAVGGRVAIEVAVVSTYQCITTVCICVQIAISLLNIVRVSFPHSHGLMMIQRLTLFFICTNNVKCRIIVC